MKGTKIAINEKDITRFGQIPPQADGSGVQVIFLNDERLVSFARITGGISDSGILELLRTAEGFRRLVRGIGV